VKTEKGEEKKKVITNSSLPQKADTRQTKKHVVAAVRERGESGVTVHAQEVVSDVVEQFFRAAKEAHRFVEFETTERRSFWGTKFSYDDDDGDDDFVEQQQQRREEEEKQRGILFFFR
jgi:hypothetical protein